MALQQDKEIALIEKAIKRVGIKSLLNHGAGSLVHSEGVQGVTHEHLLAYTREIALHCAVALATNPDPISAEPVAWAIFAPNGNIRMWSVAPDAVARAAAGFDQEPIPLYAAPQPNAALADGWVSVDERLPEPGKPVLLDIGKGVPLRALWAAKHTVEAGDECPDAWAEYDEARDTYYCPEGWYEWNRHEETHWAVGEKAVAWMDMPAPPTLNASKEGNGHGQ